MSGPTLHQRREETRISTRPRGSEPSTICSTICANRSAKAGSHLAAQAARYKVGAELRLPLIDNAVIFTYLREAVNAVQ